MSLTREQVRAWRPHDLVEVASEWNRFADDMDEHFRGYVNLLTKTSAGGYWEGATASKAQDTAHADRKHLEEMTGRVRGLAQLLIDHWYTIEAPLMRAKTALDILEKDPRCFIGEAIAGVSVKWEEVSAAERPELEQVVFDFTDGAEKAVAADEALKQKLQTQAADLPAFFTSASALGSTQGKEDGSDLTGGTMSPEDTARLVDAGQLWPDQLAALQAGETVTIPASQMQYLTEVARSLDGKSPAEITQIMEKLPLEARSALANGLQLVSNEHIDGGAQGKGGLERLPSEMKKSLTRDDLVEKNISPVIFGPSEATVELNGVADNQAIAGIAAAGDDRYQQGSALDRKLLDVGRQYLAAQVGHEKNPATPEEFFLVDGQSPKNNPVTEPIFAAIGPDKPAIEAALTDPKTGKEFLTNTLTHQWTDDGKAVATLFHFNPGDPTVENPYNTADMATATRTGNIMSTVGQYLSTEEQWKKFADIGGNQSAGAANPQLVQTLSHSMTPYIDQLAGEQRNNLPGFNTVDSKGKSWIDPDSNNNSFTGSARVFALMNTDQKAGEDFTGAAINRILQNESAYAHDPHGPGSTGALRTAGRINALMDLGIQDGLQASNDNKHDIAKESYERKASVYDAMKAGTQFGLTMGGSTSPLVTPFAEATKSIIDGGGDSLKNSIIGEEPDDEDKETARLIAPNFDQRNYEVLARMNLSPEAQQFRPELFNNGELKPWNEIQQSNRLESQVNELMRHLNCEPNEFLNAYNNVTRPTKATS